MYRKIILIVLLFGAVFANSNQKVILITGTAHGIGKSTAQYLLDKNMVDGVICVGCVIQGETKHFDYVCQGATNGIMNVGLRYNKATTFCVLTDQNEQQSIERSGGKHGNKGIECAIACLKMVELKKSIGNTNQKIGF